MIAGASLWGVCPPRAHIRALRLNARLQKPARSSSMPRLLYACKKHAPLGSGARAKPSVEG